MNLTKAQRATLKAMFDEHCAYCGVLLGDRWHADHVESVRREWWKKKGGFERPQHDHIDNMMPACPPCNLDKHAMTLEQWREKLQGAVGVLQRNQPTYRHAVRFGLVHETGARIVFYFERFNRRESL